MGLRKRFVRALVVSVLIVLTSFCIYGGLKKISNSLPKDLYTPPHQPYVAVTASTSTQPQRLGSILKSAEIQVVSVWRYGV